MNVPKWLIPVISVIAAVAVGVSLAFVGAGLASRQVVEKAAGTTAAQVVEPVATGLTNADIAALEASDKRPASRVSGSVQVSLPGGKSVKPGLNREVDLIASGSRENGSNSPTPTPLPDSRTVGVTPYVAVGSPHPANDPCARPGGATPASCPDGLGSVVLALTAAPAPDFTVVPFEAPCTPTTTPDPRFSDRATVQVTLTSTVPMSYSVHFVSSPPTSNPGGTTPHGIVTFATDSSLAASWNRARVRDVPVASLPILTTCAAVPLVWADGRLVLDITGTASDGGSIIHHLTMNAAGPGLPGPLRVQHFGSDAFVAYGEFPANQSLQIRAYPLHAPSDATCQDVSPLHQLLPVYSRTDTIGTSDIAEVGIPASYTQRTAVGFRTPAGSVLLLCGNWFNGSSSASFDRIRSLRTSQILLESPGLVGRVDIRGVFRSFDRGGGSNLLRGDIARVHAFATFDDGTPCGDTYDWTPGHAPRNDTLVCTAPANESFDLEQGGFTDVVQRADVNITIQVVGTNGARAHTVFRINLEQPVCAGCDYGQLVAMADRADFVHLPDPYSNPLDQPGGMEILSGWGPEGTSQTPRWVVSTPSSFDGDPDAIDSPPRFNTDSRIVVDTAHTTPTDVTARLDFEADKDGAYIVTLHSASGGAPCTVNGATSVSVGGQYPTARATVPIFIPHLCHGAIYVATLQTIEGTDLVNLDSEAWTGYGYGYGNGWLGFLFATPFVPVTVQYTETVSVPTGSALTDLSLHLGVTDLHPGTDLVAGCASQTFTHTGTRTMQLGSTVQLHLQYRFRHITSAAGRPCAFPAADVAPIIDTYPTFDLNAVMANPNGIRITSGAYSVVIKVAPNP